MSVSRIEYLENFLTCADFVVSGRKGSISGSRWLITNYDPLFYPAIGKHLKNSDERVRAEVVSLFASVRERAPLDDIREMRMNDKDVVKTACLGYLDALKETDDMMPRMFDILEHKGGNEFRKAAAAISAAGRGADVPRLRKIYGQVTGEMREHVKNALTAIIERDPELMNKKELLLSVPVFPDENKFLSFLDKGITYLDIRYRDAVSCRSAITEGTYSNVRNAIVKMRVRMFNEADNLRHYGKECARMYDDLLSLLSWASADLSSKTVEDRCTNAAICPGCGSAMISRGGVWRCIDCIPDTDTGKSK